MSEFTPEQYVPFIDPTEAVFVMDPKEAARLAYDQPQSETNYATFVETKKELRERRSARLADRTWKQNHMPTVDQLIGESLDSVVEPEAPDWSQIDWSDDDISTDGPAPIYYDGPYDPVKEAKRQRDAKLAQDQEIMTKSESIFEALDAGSLTKGQALVALMAETYGREREWLLEIMSDIDEGKKSEANDSSVEFSVITGAGNLATRRTLDFSPYEDIDFFDGFHIIEPR